MSVDHPKFFHHPVFGYAGIVLPAQNLRAFGAKFEWVKARQFRVEILASGKHPRRWEKKGSEIFTTGSHDRFPQRVDFIADLSAYLARLHGRLFFYGERKPVGTAREVFGRIFGEHAAAESRIWLPETREPIRVQALRTTRRWTVRRQRDREAPSAPRLTQRVGDSVSDSRR